jgi:hypothetical protein
VVVPLILVEMSEGVMAESAQMGELVVEEDLPSLALKGVHL